KSIPIPTSINDLFSDAPAVKQIDRPADGQPLEDFFKQPGDTVEGFNTPGPDHVKLMTDDTELVKLLATREPDNLLYKELIADIERLLPSDRDGDGTIGPAQTQELFTYAFSALRISFDGPDIPNIGRTHVAVTFTGAGCGTAATANWTGTYEVAS